MCSVLKVLEGDRVDDFFFNFYEDNFLYQFGNMNLRNFKYSFLVFCFIFLFFQSQILVFIVDKILFIESEEILNVLDYCQFFFNIFFCVNFILEVSFDFMWNSNGEVFY